MNTDAARTETETSASWVHFDHDADIGICGRGLTPADAFEQAALAMTAVVTDKVVKAQTSTRINCRAPDLEVLFIDWLNALVFEMATGQVLFSRFEVQIDENSDWRLKARAWGETVDQKRHTPAVEVKGATFTELSVRQEPSGTWLAQCVLDV
jgi:SHS2 domain-containing protein